MIAKCPKCGRTEEHLIEKLYPNDPTRWVFVCLDPFCVLVDWSEKL